MDFWDWLKSLRTWWWMIVVLPLLAASIAWVLAPEPEYESVWTVNIYFDDPLLADIPTYFDFVFLDDLDLLLETSVLGDVMYMRLPEDAQSSLSRQEFGDMFSSARRAHFVEITVSGDDPDLITVVAETVERNLEEVANFYMVPPAYPAGAANVNVLDPISVPEMNNRPRQVAVASVTMATLLISIAGTGVAEWLRLSYRAKYSAR